MAMYAPSLDINQPKAVAAVVWTICVSYLFLLLLPALVGGMVDTLCFTPQQAGYVASAHLGGMMLGALASAALAGRIRPRTGLLAAVACLVALESTTAFASSVLVMPALRLAAGLCCGIIAGLGAALVSANRDPDRVFALVFMAQYATGALGLFALPYMGLKAGFLTLAVLGGTVLAVLPQWR